MSKKETLIEFFHNIGIDYYDNATQVHSVMEQYAQAKVLEALEDCKELARSRHHYSLAETIETEVKPKYK